MLRRSLFLAWVLVGASGPLAYASDPEVLVLEPSGAAASFLVALQIQLSGLAEALRVPMPSLASAGESIERAGRLVRERHALAAVWVDQKPGAGPAIVYVVGEREGRALIEVVRVPGGRGPDLERTIALKVRELIAAMRRGQAARPEAAQLLQAEPTRDTLPPTAAQPSAAWPSEQPEDTSTTAPSWSAVAIAGVRLGSQPDLGLGRWGLGLGAGPVLALRQVRLGVLLGFDAFPSIEVARGADQVRFWEWTASAALHAQLRTGGFWLGARIGPQLEGVSAHGVTGAGKQGDASPTSGALLVALDAEVPVASSISLLAGLQLQALASRVHLGVNRQDIVDLGRVRARIGLDLAARF